MLRLTNRPPDNHGYVGIKHLAQMSLPHIRKNKTCSERLFRKVVRLYFKKAFEMIMQGKTFNFPHIGDMFVAKILCTEFYPKNYTKGHVDVDKNDGFFYFIAWDRPKRYRTHKLCVSRKWKKLINDIFVNTNQDALEI